MVGCRLGLDQSGRTGQSQDTRHPARGHLASQLSASRESNACDYWLASTSRVLMALTGT